MNKISKKKALKKIDSQLSLFVKKLYETDWEDPFPFEKDEETFHKDCSKALKTYLTRFERAMKKMIDYFQLYSTIWNNEQVQSRLNDDDFKLRPGETMQEALGFTDRLMEDIYRYGYDEFEQHRYEEASDIFLLLSTLNKYISAFWIALGRAEEKKEEIHSALLAYTTAFIVDSSNFGLTLDVVNCFVKLNQRKNAEIYLDKVIEEARAYGGQETFINMAFQKKSEL